MCPVIGDPNSHVLRYCPYRTLRTLIDFQSGLGFLSDPRLWGCRPQTPHGCVLRGAAAPQPEVGDNLWGGVPVSLRSGL